MTTLPRVIYSTFTKYSGEIKVIEVGSVRRLLVGGLVQSVNRDYPEVADKVWGQLINLPYPINPQPKVLMLGLGGGTTAHLISQNLEPLKIKVVELDPRIIEVARNFFDLDLIEGLNVVNGDAFDFVGKALDSEFDLIIVDLYLGHSFPEAGLKKSFYLSLKKILSSGGVVVINRIFHDQDKEERKGYSHLLNRVYGEVFEKVLPGPSTFKNYLYFCRV